MLCFSRGKAAILCLALLGGSPIALAAAPGAPTGNVVGATDGSMDPEVTNPKEQAGECDIGPGKPIDPAHPRLACMTQEDALKRSAEASSYLAFYQQTLSQFGVEMKDPKKKQEIKDAVTACVNGDESCKENGNADHDVLVKRKKNDLLKALVQYNFGKDVKASLLESQTRAENMRSLGLSPQELRDRGWRDNMVRNATVDKYSARSTTSSSPVPTNSFKLNPSTIQVFDPEHDPPELRAKLGTAFNQFYGDFIDSYANTVDKQSGPKSRWHYVTAKTAAVGGGSAVSVIGAGSPNSMNRGENASINKRRMESDIKSQSDPRVEEIVASYKKNFRDVVVNPTTEEILEDRTRPGKPKITKQPVDSMRAALDGAGFGLSKGDIELAKKDHPDHPALAVAQGTAIHLNQAVLNAEKRGQQANTGPVQDGFEREPSSAGANVAAGKPAYTSVTFDVDRIDCFLDEIWPPGASEGQKPQCANQSAPKSTQN